MRLSAVSAQAGGARVLSSPHFLVRIARDIEPVGFRAAAVVSARVSRAAVERNLLRRRIYACLRPFLVFLQDARLVIQAKQGAAALSFKELQSELSELLRRI